MSLHSRPGYQPRKHSKTFTGCWTCRGRKVKCDEQRPACRQCRVKNLECQGYFIRLHWVQPQTGHDDSSPAPSAPRAKSQRSQISIEPTQSVLQCNEIDQILTSIDALDPKRRGSDSLFLDGFGVFGCTHAINTHSPASADVAVQRVPSTASPPIDDQSLSFSSPDSDQLIDQLPDPLDISDILPVAVFLDSINPSELLGSDSLDAFDFSIPAFGSEDFTNSLPAPIDFGEPPSKAVTDLQPLSPPLHDAWLTRSIPRPPLESPLTTQERFLMSHYVNRVVRLFCVIDNAKSPWKTIHLPRALQSVGELTITGSTSRIQGALRNALLSISAFYLSNDNKSMARKDEAAKWASEASWFRCKAVNLLKEAVENDFYTEPKPKYKEFLATMLSMISINVMSGHLDTCGVHLDGAWRLMAHARNWKTKYSTKARALHRIYFYLRTIYESTALGSRAEAARVENSPPDELIQVSTRTAVPPPADDDAPASLMPDSVARMVTYESIYGVPQKLLVLLAKAVHLIGRVTAAREEDNNVLVPDHLIKECDELETCIMDKRFEDELEHWLPGQNGTNSTIIRHQTQAFHNAVIIYFAQHVRLLGHRYLQPYVRAVLRHVEAIERVKTETYTLAAPLYWPAFIAASEAFDGELQDGFRRWYEQVEVYGIEGVRTGFRVLLDVWEEGPPGANRRTSLWRVVVNRTGRSLMLT